jgi:glucokinase
VSRDGARVVGAPNLPWRDVAAASILSKLLDGVDVRVANDLKAIGWGEYRFGAGRDAETLLAIYVGTGVGGARIEHGRLALGAEGFAGEIGHVAAGPLDGPVCGCGLRGCLEAYVGGRAFAQVTSGRTASELEALARSGDERAREVLTDAGTRLGIVTAGAVMLDNPDVLILGGGVWDAAETLRSATLCALRERVSTARLATLRLAPAQLGDSAGIAGAADLARAEIHAR